MTVRRRGAGFPQRRGPGRTDWGRVVPVGSTFVTSGAKVFLASVILANPGIGETVRRTRGVISVKSDQDAAPEDISGALGFVVVNDLALGVGATAIPGPVTDSSDDGWFVWEPLLLTGREGGSSVSSMQVAFDSKAMRKVEHGFGVAVMVENIASGRAFDVQVAFSILTSRL